MAKKAKPKSNKVPRNKEKYPGLNHKRAVKNRRELLEVDYLDKLSPEEKDWLSRFNEEYVISNFKHKGKLLDGSKKAKKASYDANNARNRCLLTKVKTTGLLDNTINDEHLASKMMNNSIEAYENIEDVLIDAIDRTTNLKKKSE